MKSYLFKLHSSLFILLSTLTFSCEEIVEVPEDELNFINVDIEPSSALHPITNISDNDFWVLISDADGNVVDYENIGESGSVNFDSITDNDVNLTVIHKRTVDDFVKFYIRTIVNAPKGLLKFETRPTSSSVTSIGKHYLSFEEGSLTENTAFYEYPRSSRFNNYFDMCYYNGDPIEFSQYDEEESGLLILSRNSDGCEPIEGYDYTRLNKSNNSSSDYQYLELTNIKAGETITIKEEDFTDAGESTFTIPSEYYMTSAYVTGYYKDRDFSLYSYYNHAGGGVSSLTFPDLGDVVEGYKYSFQIIGDNGYYNYDIYNADLITNITPPSLQVDGYFNTYDDFEATYQGDFDIYIMKETNYTILYNTSTGAPEFEWTFYGKSTSGKIEFNRPNIPEEIAGDFENFYSGGDVYTQTKMNVMLHKGSLNYMDLIGEGCGGCESGNNTENFTFNKVLADNIAD